MGFRVDSRLQRIISLHLRPLVKECLCATLYKKLSKMIVLKTDVQVVGKIRVAAKSVVVFLYFLDGHNRTQHTAPFSNGFLIGHPCIFFLSSMYIGYVHLVLNAMFNVSLFPLRPQSHSAHLTLGLFIQRVFVGQWSSLYFLSMCICSS